MFVIGAYDVSTVDKAGRARLPKLMKLMRQYLHHSQRSVFEGEITEGDLLELRKSINKIINKDEDYVVIFKVANHKNVKRENLGIEFDPGDVII